MNATEAMNIIERIRSAEMGSRERVKRFIDEWRRTYPRAEAIYGLNLGSDREAVLLIDDLDAIFTELAAKDTTHEGHHP